MCIDDYQFRHYTATRQKQCRRFIFINEDEIEKTFLVNISQFQENGEVALCKILFHLSSKGLVINNRKFYMPMYNISIEPGDYCKVPFEALTNKEIFFRSYKKGSQIPSTTARVQGFIQKMDEENVINACEFEQPNGSRVDESCQKCYDMSHKPHAGEKANQIHQDTDHEGSIQNISEFHKKIRNDQSHSHKRLKEPQRQIFEVIMAVKKWRKLYENKKMNLTKSAKLIGISKKSLDDYYLVIRIGQILGFNYQQNLNNKMGDLRAFIRTFDYKVTGKLTKQVKCFDLVPEIDLQSLMIEAETQQRTLIQQFDLDEQQQM